MKIDDLIGIEPRTGWHFYFIGRQLAVSGLRWHFWYQNILSGCYGQALWDRSVVEKPFNHYSQKSKER
ncbi:MAG: hypothetical protein JW976_12180 [Syntrophaceae bacterium]|nr:hypothetical protein [Syntrophaceae bacterium]